MMNDSLYYGEPDNHEEAWIMNWCKLTAYTHFHISYPHIPSPLTHCTKAKQASRGNLGLAGGPWILDHQG